MRILSSSFSINRVNKPCCIFVSFIKRIYTSILLRRNWLERTSRCKHDFPPRRLRTNFPGGLERTKQKSADVAAMLRSVVYFHKIVDKTYFSLNKVDLIHTYSFNRSKNLSFSTSQLVVSLQRMV